MADALDDDDDLEGLLEDAPDDLDDEDELVDWFASRLDLGDDEVGEMSEAAAETGGICAALALLKLFSAGWDALDDAQDAATDAQLEAADKAEAPHEVDEDAEPAGASLGDKLADIAGKLADALSERLEDGWGDEDGSSIADAANITAQTEYSEAKHEGDVDAGWEYAKYVSEAGGCDVCSDCNGTVLPIDDPWWDDHEPDENHPNCRCLKVPLSEDEARAEGIDRNGPDVDVSGWKDAWPPDVSDYPEALEVVYHGKL